MSHTPIWIQRALYLTGKALFGAAFRLVWRARVSGRENIPMTGGLIFAPNHISLADPPLVGCMIPRTIHFMAKQELFDIPFIGWFINQVNAFPIKRVERDVGAFKTAQRILTSGGAIIVFAEGHRQRNGRLGRAKPGIGMLAIKTNTPVVPVFVHNSDQLSSFKPIHVVFGEPIAPGEEADYQVFSDRVMQAIAALKEKNLGSQN